MLQKLFQENFYLLQIGLGVIALLVAWKFLNPHKEKSGFKVREADKLGKGRRKVAPGKDDLASARMAAPLALPGVRLQGHPHEILGVPADASESQIKKAYSDLAKRYHPDRAGPPGSQAWKDAHQILPVITAAKNELLKRRKGR